jgi:predicted PurR-regulated permease PerM
MQDGQNACQQLLEQLQTALPAVQGATAPLIDLLEKQLPLESPIFAAPTLLSVNSYFGFDLKFIAGAVGQVVSFLVNMAFVFMASIYLSIDGDRFMHQIVTAAPVGAQSDIALLAERISVVWNSFFRGQITIMIVIGIVVWLGNLVLGTPGAIFLGFFAGLMEVVPILGPVVAAIPAVIAAVVSGSSVWSIDNLPFALIVIVFYVVVQALENTLIVPRLMSRAVNLHPLLVMAGVVVGASLWGIFGILLAAPIIASVLVIVRYAYDRLADRDPFAGPMPEPVSVKEAAGILSDRLRQWADRIRINQAKSAEGEPVAPPATDQTLERVADRIDEFAARLPTDGEGSTELPPDPHSGAVG